MSPPVCSSFSREKGITGSLAEALLNSFSGCNCQGWWEGRSAPVPVCMDAVGAAAGVTGPVCWLAPDVLMRCGWECCREGSTARRVSEMILSHCSALWDPTWGAASSSSVLSPGKTWTCWSQCRGGHESVQRDEPFCEDMLRELQKRRLLVDLIVAFQYLKGTYKKAEEKLFRRAYCSRMRD